MPLPTYPSLTPGPTQPGQGAYGTVPTVPNPIATAGGAITGNIGNLGSLYGLTTGTSGASAAGANQQYLQNLPGYAALTSTGSSNILSDLHGQVSPDVINLLGQQAAERGVGFGAGSPNSNAALLSSLGRTSMGLQAQGQQELTSAIGRTPVGPAFNPASMLVSPGDVQGAAYGANVLGAAPNPSDAAGAAIAAARSGLAAGRGAVPGAPAIGGGGAGPSTAPASFWNWASDRPNAPAGGPLGYTAPTVGETGQDWYHATFGNQQFGGGAPGSGDFLSSDLGLSEEDMNMYQQYGLLGGSDTTGGLGDTGLGDDFGP